MASEVGQAYLSILPSARGFAANLQREIGSDIARAGKTAGADYGKNFGTEAVAKAKSADVVGGVGVDAKTAGGKAGQDFGKAFVDGFGDLPRTTKGLISQTTAEFKALPAEMKVAAHQANAKALRELTSGIAPAGRRVGEDFGKAFGSAAESRAKSADVTRGVGADARQAGEQAGADYGKAFADEAESTAAKADIGGDVGDKVKAGGAVAGAAAGVAVVAGVGEALDRGALDSKLAAQLGGGPRAKRATKVASSLFQQAWGESVGEVNDAVSSVVTGIGGMRHASQRELKGVSRSVLDIGTAFDQDATSITRAVDQLVRTDLAKGPRDALDIITRGFQSGANEADDLLDTYSEYGTQFRKLGLSGEEATGLLSQGLQAGARDADIVADSFKEFSLRSVGALTQLDSKGRPQITELGKAFETLGVDVLDNRGEISKAGWAFQNDLAAGGNRARDALEQVLDRLRKVKDPLTQSRTAVALFGTQAEDMGDALYALDPSKAVDTLGKVRNAANRMGSDLNDNASARVTEFKRTLQNDFVTFLGDKVVPAADKAYQAFKSMPAPVRHTVEALSGIAGIGIGGAFLGAKFISAIGSAKTALGNLGVAGRTSKTQIDAVGSNARTAVTPVGNLGTTARTTRGRLSTLGTTARTAGSKLGGFARLGGAVLGLAAVAEGVQYLKEDISDALPGMNQLSLRLNNLGPKADLGALGPQFKDIGDSIRRISDPSITQKGLDKLYGLQRGIYGLIGVDTGEDAALENARRRIGALDEAVTNLVNVKGVGAAKRSLSAYIKTQHLSGDEVKWLRDQMPLYADALAAARLETNKGRRSTEAASEADRKHRRDLDDLGDQLGLNRRRSRELSDAIETQEASSRAAGRGERAHREQLRAVADQMGLNREQTRKLIREYGDVPKKVETDAKFNHRDAERDVTGFTKFFNTALGNIKNEEVGVKLSASARGAVRGVQNIIGGTVGLFTGKAHGGEIRGGVPGRDSVPSMLMPGEHVFTSDDVRKAGGQSAMYAIRKMIQRGEFAKKGDLQYFRSGGAVEVDTRLSEVGTRAAMASLSGAFDTIGDKISDSLSSRISQLLATGGGRPLGPGGSLSPGQIAVGQAFAKSQAGLPYQWGGTGNPSWDCSGFVGGTLLAALGSNPRQRIGTTASMPWSGWSPGVGTFTAGTDPGSHMAGNIGGLGIESRGGDGVTLGSGITPLTSFARLDHYDRGGVLKPGWTAAYNGTGRDEYVVKGGGPSRSRSQRVELVITNWRTGQGYMRGIARDEVDGADDFTARTERMG